MTTALLRRLGLIPAEQPAAAHDAIVEAPVVTYAPRPEPTYASEREARFHNDNVTR